MSAARADGCLLLTKRNKGMFELATMTSPERVEAYVEPLLTLRR
jgi:hypothetical protein